jgi:hypothetical protein
MGFRFRVQDRRREEPEIAGGARNIESPGERERLTRVDRLSAREFIEVTFDQIGDA